MMSRLLSTVARRWRRAAWIAVLSFGVVLSVPGCESGDSVTDPGLKCGPFPDQKDSPYVLPYAVGQSFLVVQGSCTTRSHAFGTRRTYAYDFDQPTGTPILAARAGEVVAMVQHFADGTRVVGEENFVYIVHADGTMARYFHLTTNGARVVVGESVEQGQLIGLSGDSGWSSLPHLHFDVHACEFCDVSVPVTFRNTREHPNGLLEGESYVAGAF